MQQHQQKQHHQQQSHRSSPSTSAVGSIKSSNCIIPMDDNEIHYANIESTSNTSNSLLSSSWLPASKLPSFNWTRQFNDTLACIGSMLQRNFQIENHPSVGNVSEASASTATIGSTATIDDNGSQFTKIGKTTTFSGNSKRHRSNTTAIGDPNELDMLVLKTVDDWDDDSDDSY